MLFLTVSTVEYSTCDSSKYDKSKYKSPSCTVYTVNRRKRGRQLSRTGVNFAYRFFFYSRSWLESSFYFLYIVHSCSRNLKLYYHSAWMCTFYVCTFKNQHFYFVFFEDVSMNHTCLFDKMQKNLEPPHSPGQSSLMYFSAILYCSEVSRFASNSQTGLPGMAQLRTYKRRVISSRIFFFFALCTKYVHLLRVSHCLSFTTSTLMRADNLS